MKISIMWEPHDLWLGVFWCRIARPGSFVRTQVHGIRLYVCLLPCLPIVFEWWSAPRQR